MRHLSPEELLDIAEGTTGETSAPHLATCEICRRELSELRAVMTEAAQVEVPEPSPLFWGHLSARVRDAVAADAANRPMTRPLGSRAWSWRLAAAMSVVVVLVVGLTLSSQRERRDDIAVQRSESGEPPIPSSQEAISMADDPSLALLADLAGELDWDQEREAGIVMRAGTADGALIELSGEERMELHRLLTAELAGAGA